MTGSIIKKFCEYWTYYGTVAKHQEIQKPIRPTFEVRFNYENGFKQESGKMRANLYLMVPAWYAKFATE